MILKEHIDDIRNQLKEGLFINEAAVSQGIVLRLLNVLTWPTYNTQVIIPEYSVEGRRVDYALCHPPSKPIVFIEVKQVGNIEGAERQLFEYAFHEGVPIAILTDGQEWHFFHPSGRGDYRERRVYKLDLIERDSEKSAERLNRYLNYDSIRTEEAVEAIKADYEKVVQQRQVEARLPEVWNELVQGKNEDLLLIVMDAAKNKIGYEPTEEQVLDFLKSLKQEQEIKKPSKRKHLTRNPGLFVTMPDGEIINHKVSATTFSEAIEKLGIDRVRNLERQVNGIPLISTSKHPTYDQRKSGQYYIMTNTDTKTKKRLLEEIATELRESLKVEIVEKS